MDNNGKDEKEQKIIPSTAIDANQSYGGEEIEVLEGLEAVRQTPGMYIGSTSEAGLHHLVYEIVDNSIDEALAGFCNEINVEILKDNIIRVTDNGRGIPVGIQPKMGIPAVTVVFTILHAGGKFGGGGYKVSGGLHGVGGAVVNALSEWLEVEVFDGKKIYKQRFEEGKVASELEIIGDTDKRGSRVTFKADAKIFDAVDYDYNVLLEHMRESAFLNAGLKITMEDQRGAEVVGEVLDYEGGIITFVDFIQKRRSYVPVNEKVIYLSGTSEDGEENVAEIAMQYNDGYHETMYSFVNNIRTPDGGTHEVGFRTALTRAFNDYAHKYGFLEEEDRFHGDDVREGVVIVMSLKMKRAQFEGQVKGKLGNSEIRGFIDSLTYEQMTNFFEENPAEGKRLMDKVQTAAKARHAAKRARELTRRKSVFESLSLPGKLVDCSSKDIAKTEIYIVEGDSAAGTAKDGRDSRYQAILPVWGKMLNVEKSRLDKVYTNEKLMPLVTALGTGIGEDFDIGKLRYGKIVLMSDADVDGLHIRTLMLTFLFRYLKPLIKAGHIYIAQPPLYKVYKGNKVRYANSEEEREQFQLELDTKNVQRYKGLGEMNADQLWDTTLDPKFRTMLKVGVEDAAKADEVFTILMGDKVEPRRQFIETNAVYAENIDV